MGKSKSKSAAGNRKSGLPQAPWLFINDATSDAAFGDQVVANLVSLIPIARISRLDSEEPNHLHPDACWERPTTENCIVIFGRRQLDASAAVETANEGREKAIELGKNFASVNLTKDGSLTGNGGTVNWGTNHLELNTTRLAAPQAADKIFRWLFKVLTVPETLHLIPEADMLAVDDKNFPDYAYCPVNESRKHRKDAKIQFVALIVSKPEVGPDQRLQWKVVDRTGEANFFFQYRGVESKTTWDWVLQLQPGDRKALPRMPMVHIKEKKRIRVVKAPFRGVAVVVGGAGLAIKGVGKGLCWVSEKVHMGQSGQWVAEADLDEDGKIKQRVKKDAGVAGPAKKEVKIFNEKGEKMWKDDDDTASTSAGSIYDEKAVKEFC